MKLIFTALIFAVVACLTITDKTYSQEASVKSDTAAKELETVNISSRKPLIERKNNRVILNVANSILTTGSTALELLAKAPGVSIDQNGNISYRGKSRVNVMIDGKQTHLSPRQLNDVLKNLNGNTIQAIELMSSPSAKYDAAGSAGMINIKLKKNTSNGTNGSMDIGGGYGRFYKSNAGININSRSKSFNLFGSYNFVNNKDFEDLNIRRSNVSANETTFFNQQARDIYLRENHSYKAGLDYFIDSNHIIGFVFNGYTNNIEVDNKNTTYIGVTPMTLDSSILGINPNKSKFTNQAYNLNYTGKLDTSGQELNVDIDYSSYISQNNTIYNNYFHTTASLPAKDPFIFRNKTPSNVKIWIGKADYTYPFNAKMKLETGLKSSYVNTDNDFQFENLENGTYVTDASKSNRFLYKEYINAAYANLQKEFNFLTVQAGLRTELTNSEGNSLTTSSIMKRQYIDFFPNLSINRQLNKNNEIGLSYNRRIDRPDYQSLNPFIYFVDLYTFQQGNPLLYPQYTNSFELVYSFKKRLNVTLGYSRTCDVITTTLITDTLNKTLLLKDENLTSQKTYNLNASLPVSITQWWSTNNDATLYYTNFNASELMGIPFESGKLTYIFNTTQNLIINKSMNAELAFNYQSSQVYGTYAVKPLYGIDLGISRTFAKNRATIKVAASDLLNTRRARIRSAISGQDYQLYQKQESRIFKFTFTYNFGSSLVKAVRNRSNGSSAEQNRVKTGN